MSEPLSSEEYVAMQVEIQRRYLENMSNLLEPLLAKLNPHLDPVRRREDIRDAFAAASLNGYRQYAGQWYVKFHGKYATPEQIAEWAYADADAMLKARE